MSKQIVLVAVSGGVDSVVLLDMLVKKGEHELVVAHFDHGIREDSADDTRFVRELAGVHHLPFVTKREELGANASEELARTRRYTFLRAEAKKLEAAIATAHHADDVIETIAINIYRGTGWRGAAVLDTPEIVRPLLSFTKEELRTYAVRHRLEWVEDSTNAGTQYLRNRIRRLVALHTKDETRRTLLDVWRRQVAVKAKIQKELASLAREDDTYSRHFFTQIDPAVAGELLRAAIVAKTRFSPTRPQIERALLAVKTAQANTAYDVGGGVTLRFTMRTFFVETP